MKLLYSLFTGFICLMMFSASAQTLEFSTTSSSGAPGDLVTSTITAVNFDAPNNPVSFQWNILWDRNNASFSSLTNIATELSSNSDFSLVLSDTAMGRITVLYTVFNNPPIVLPDPVDMFDLTLKLELAGSTTVTHGSSGGIPVEYATGTGVQPLDVSDTWPLTVTGPGGGGGGGTTTPCDGLTQPTLVFQDTMVTSGSAVCIPVYAYELNDMTDFTFTFDVDASQLILDSLTNINPLVSTMMFNPATGVAFFNDASGVGVTIPACEVLFELCVTGTGAGGTTTMVDLSTSPAPEFSNSTGQFTVNILPGTVTVNASGGGGGGGTATPCDGLTQPTLVFQDTMVTSGSAVCIPVYAYELNDMTDFTFTFDVDASQLILDSLTNINPLVSTMMFNPATGVAFFNDASGVGVTIPACEVLFELCVTGTGAGGTTTMVDLSTSPASEFSNSMGQFTVTILPGTVTVNASGGGGGGGTTTPCDGLTQPTLVFQDTMVTSGSAVCIPVYAYELNDMTDFTFTFDVDASQLILDSLTNINPLVSTMMFNPATGVAFFTDASGVGVTIPACEVLFELCVTGTGAGGTTTTVDLSTSPAPEFSNSTGQFTVNILPGTVTVNASGGGGGGTTTPCDGLTQPTLVFQDTMVTSGEAVCIPVYAYELNDMTDFTFTFDVDANQLILDSLTNINPLVSTMMFNPATGVAFFTDASGVGVTIPACEVLFELCVTGTGAGGTTTMVDLSTSPAPEFSNSTGQFTVNILSGTVTVNAPGGGGPAGTPCDNLTQPSVIINSDTAMIGDTVCVPILAYQLVDIVSFGFELIVDSTVARFVDTANVNPLISGNGFFWNIRNGQATRFLWAPPGMNPEITIADCDTLFEVCYEMIGMDMDVTTISFGTGIAPDFNTSSGNIVDSLYEGSLRIEDAGGPPCDPIVITEAVTFPLCNGDSNGEIDLTATGGDGMFTYSWADGPTTPDRTGLAAGTYTVTVTSCTEVNTKSIIVGQWDPLTAPADITQVRCNGEATGEIDLNPMGGVPPYDYDWTGPGTVDGFQVQENLSAGSYSVVLSDANMCTVSASFTVSEPSAAISIASIETQPSGGLNNGEIDITPSGGTSPYTFSWTGPGVNANAEDQTGLDAGTYTVTVTDANMCTDSITVPLTRGAPSITISSTPSCVGESTGTITTVVTDGTPPYTLVWTGGLQAQLNHTNVAPGTYNLTVTDFAGVVVMANVTVGTHPTISLAASITPSTGLNNGAIDLTVSGGGGGTFSYAWDDGPITKDRTGLAAGQYTVIVTDNVTGCTATDTFDVQVNFDDLVATVTTEGVNCNAANGGSCDGLFSISIASSAGDVIATFTNTGTTGLPTTATLSGPGPHEFTGLCPGTFDVLLTDNLSMQTFSSMGLEITEPTELLISDFTIIPVVGNGAANGGVDITIDGGTPGYTTVWNAGPNPMNEDNLGLIVGSYTATIVDANGCRLVSSPYAVEQFEIHSVVIENVRCASELNGAIDISVRGATGPFSYLWSNGAVTQDLVNVQAGTYTVTVTDDASMRQVVGTYTVEAESNLFASAIVVSDNSGFQTTCIGAEDAQIQAAASGGVGPVTFVWNTGFVGPLLSGVGAGTYTVTAMDSLQCESTAEVTVSDPPAMLADIRSDNIRCAGESNGRLTATITGGAGNYSYEWFSSTNELVSVDRVALGLSADTYALIVTDANGCTQTFTAGISEPEPLMVDDTDVTPATAVSPGAINLSITGGTQPYVISWEGRSETTALLDNIPSGTYTYSVTGANECDVITRSIKVPNGDFDCLIASSVLTPGTMDNLNDIFLINCIEDFPTNTVEIFNRWGQLVRDFTGYDNNSVVFDGRTRSGEVLPEGGYFYVIRYRGIDNVEQIKKGSLNIIR